MLELVAIYQWTIGAAILSAVGLSLLGVQIATRGQTLQVLCLSQGAIVGVLLAMSLFAGETIPSLFAFLFGAGTYLLTEVLKGRSTNAVFFVAMYAGLMALCHLVAALFPGIEVHITRVHFGDIATMSNAMSRILLIVFAAGLGFLFVKRREITRISFQAAVFGAPPKDWAFVALALIWICVSVQHLGLLFTVGMLAIPTYILGQTRAGMKKHFVAVGVIAATATLIGFVLSLSLTRAPTAPTILILAALLSGALLLIRR